MTRGQDAEAQLDGLASLEALEARLAALKATRLVDSMAVLVEHVHRLLLVLRPTPAELRAVIDFLTETGHHTDARRQEWVLLADALGISAAVQDLANPLVDGATPNTVCGPFYRADMPDIAIGQSISLDGKGDPLKVTGTIRSTSGEGIGGAVVEIWQANAQGFYENQEPDLQPEHNLRGRLVADRQGRFAFQSIKPGGYSLPADGPVGRLLTRLGLALHRPAHINFRVTAPGYRDLTSQIFDRADPAVAADAIFGVKPELLADFLIKTVGARPSYGLDIDLVMAPAEPENTMPGRSSE